MKAIIEKMRADFVLVGEDRIKSGQWSEQDYADVGAAIKAAIASDEPTQVMTWARWLADLSAWVTAYRMVCAPVDQIIQLRLAEQRAAAAQGAAGQKTPPLGAAGPSQSPKHTGT